jgi:hypothetical protein
METPIRVLAIPVGVFRVCQRRQNLPGSVPKAAGSEKKRVKGAWNRSGTSHIGTVCLKEGFDNRLGNVREGKNHKSHIEETEHYVN